MLKRILFGGSVNSRTTDFALLILRLFIGGFLAAGHGWFKLKNGPENFAKFLEMLNVPNPLLAAWMATIAEFAGGILLAVGLLTRPAALFIAGTMAVAIATAHLNDPAFMQLAPKGGGSKEPALLYLVPAMFFLLVGAGRYGLDSLLRGRDDALVGSMVDRPDSIAR